MLVKQGLSDEPAKTQHHTDELPAAIRELSVFTHLPEANLVKIAARLERLECSRHEIVINQGDVGAHYYIIESGECEVLREDEDGPPTVYSADTEPAAVLLAVLSAGDAFGEEALVSGAPRNATVRMKTDGVLLRLNRDDFSDLVKTPLVHNVDPTRAEDLVALGAVWLDVRTAARHARDGLERSTNVPLRDIRERVDELHHDKTYVVYCDNGQPSAAATFLLCVRGFAACCLEGGLTEARPATRNIASVPTELEELGAELIEANEQLEQAIQIKAQADAALDVELLSLEDDDQREEQARLTERLRGLETEATTASTAFESAKQRKLELERRIRAGTAAAAARKREAQAQLEKMRRDAELRLAAEKQRLQIRYKEAAEKLQELERERLALEARFEADRKRLERELEEARARVENEAKTVREALEGDRRAAEQRAIQIRDAATRAEKQLRDETETALKDEQTRLATEFARSVAEQEQARHELEEAEGARRSAEREVIQVQSAIAAALEHRRAAEAAEREAEQARRRAEEARLRAEREAAEAKLIAAEARRQLAEATAKVHGSTAAARAQSRPAATPPDAAPVTAAGPASPVTTAGPTSPVTAAGPASEEAGDVQLSKGATIAPLKNISGGPQPPGAIGSQPKTVMEKANGPATSQSSEAKHPVVESNGTVGNSLSKHNESTTQQSTAGAETPTAAETAATPETAAAPKPTVTLQAAAAPETTVTLQATAAPETAVTPETPAAPGSKATQSVQTGRPNPVPPPVLTAVVVSKNNANDKPKEPKSTTSPPEPTAATVGQNTASALPAAGTAAESDDEATSIDDLEQQLTQARQAVEQAKQQEQRFAREEKTAAVSKAKEEELRLKLFEEMENWVEEEREKSEQDQERYIRELERLQAEKVSRQKLQQDVNAGLMADVQSVLSRDDKASDDPFEEFIRMRTMAEETSRVVKDAKVALEAQKAKSEKALAEANARLSQSRKPDQTN